MALSFRISVSSSTKTSVLPRMSLQSRVPAVSSHYLVSFLSKTRPRAITIKFTKSRFLGIKAVEESKESAEPETVNEQEEPPVVSQQGVSNVEVSELGAEIKKAMKERKEEREGELFSGVAEEIREIEWPAFGKVLGTTGVVLGVIAGSSVVLVTVNAVLAELSDRVFAGRGVQDFFG